MAESAKKRREIHVFPDYMSSGFWEDGCNINEESIEGILSPQLLMLVRTWHELWEVYDHAAFPRSQQDRYDYLKKKFDEEGKVIVGYLNDHVKNTGNDHVRFFAGPRRRPWSEETPSE